MSAQENSHQREMSRAEITELCEEMWEVGIGTFPIALKRGPTKTEKRPLCRHGHLDATTDFDTMQRMLDDAYERVGDDEEVAIGAHLGDARLVMFDYDTKNGGRGDVILEQHIAKYGGAFDRVTFTSISGATNVLLSIPDERKIGNHSPWADVDVRSENGWFVPPGVFCSWGAWEWRSGDWSDLDSECSVPVEVLGELREASELASKPAKSDEIERWLDENRLTAMPNQLHEAALQRYERGIATAGNRNPELKDALDWVKRQNESIDRRAAFERIDAAWRKRMTADGEKGRLEDAWDVLGRVVGYDNAWRAARAEASLPEALQAVDPDDDRTPGERLRSMFLSPDQLAGLPPQTYLIDGYLPDAAVVFAIGKGGVGKSFIVLDMAMKVATGGGWWNDRAVRAGNVLYVAAEGSGGISKRIEAWRKFYGVTDEPNLKVLPYAVSLYQAATADALVEAVEGQGFDLIVIDTLARSAAGADENSASDAGIIYDTLGRLQRLTGTVVVIHHTGKDATKGARGSSAWYDNVDAELTVTGSTKDFISVAVTKMKDDVEEEAVKFRTQVVDLDEPQSGIGLERGRSSLVVIKATADDLAAVGSDEGAMTRDPSAPVDKALLFRWRLIHLFKHYQEAMIIETLMERFVIQFNLDPPARSTVRRHLMYLETIGLAMCPEVDKGMPRPWHLTAKGYEHRSPLDGPDDQ